MESACIFCLTEAEHVADGQIEKFSQYIVITPEVHPLLSGAELSHARRYVVFTLDQRVCARADLCQLYGAFTYPFSALCPRLVTRVVAKDGRDL
jgi:hypothetical protein